MYCGNNRLYSKLLTGEVVLGTRYQCLRRGIGVGKNIPYDSKYEDEYEPIDPTRIYCGMKNYLPRGYDRFGSLADCHRMGVGIGKRLTCASRRRSRRKRSRKTRNKKYK